MDINYFLYFRLKNVEMSLPLLNLFRHILNQVAVSFVGPRTPSFSLVGRGSTRSLEMGNARLLWKT
jgi:hypothetical protein